MRTRVRIGLAAALVSLLAATPMAMAIEPGAEGTGRPAERSANQAGDPGVQADEQVLFEAGTNGYDCFRIPASVRTNDGTLLVFAEGRVDSCADDGDIDLVMRRSTDGGASWEPMQVLIDGNGDTRGNPSPVVDRETGRISLLSTYNPGDDMNHRFPYLQHSEDDGRTWSEPVEITDQISKPEWEFWYGTGPVHGIQLEHGEHAGRLVVPSYYNEGPDLPGGVVLVYSDDGGLTWQRGAIDERQGSLVPGENTVVELSDGRLLTLAREGGTNPEPGNRATAISSDGGESFDAPFRTEQQLPMPTVQGAALRVGDQVLFSSPAHPAAREVMSIRASTDQGETWESWQDGKVVWWGPSGYSDLVPIDDTLTGLVYEAGEDWAYETIRWRRFDQAYLDSPNGDPPGIPELPAPGPTTEDRSEHGNTAYVRDGAELVSDGRFGNALELDGSNGHVQVPYSEAIDLGSDDFTVSTWIRYTAESGNHPIFWAYRMGSNTTPQLWLRAEPESGRIRGLLGSDLDWGATVDSDGAYNDGEWHHVVLRRTGGEFELWIDGEPAGSTQLAGGEHGSVTSGSEFGIDGFGIGQRIDGAQRLAGSLDDVRVYGRALSDQELRSLASDDPALPEGLLLHLPLEEIAPEAVPE